MAPHDAESACCHGALARCAGHGDGTHRYRFLCTAAGRRGQCRTRRGSRNEIISGSRAALLARDALNRDPAAYAAQFLQRGDVSDYLRVPLSAAWRYRLGVAHAAFADIAAAAAARGVPWVVVLTPAYGGAAVAGLPPRHGIDPWQLGRAMAADVRAQGGHFIDLTSAFAAAPQLASLYYIADGHPNARGSALIAQAVAGLLAVQAAPFATCRVPV
jgi:hypothetical protein